MKTETSEPKVPGASLFLKLWRLIPAAQRPKVMMLWGMMLVGAALEVFGVGLIVPVLAVMTQPDFIERHHKALSWWQDLDKLTHTELILTSMAALVAAYALKVSFVALTIWQQSRFAFGLQASLSKQLFSCYLKQPYAFHLNHNSAQLTRNIVTEVTMLTNTAVLPMLYLATDGMVFIGIALLLFFVEPLGAICVIGVLVSAGFIFQHLTRGMLQRWGRQRQHHEGMKVQHLQQGFGAVKEVKLLGREAQLIEQYNEHNRGSAHAVQRQNVLQQMPRLWFEVLAIGSLAVLVAVMLLTSRSTESLLPTLGLFAAAAFRLMASANRVLSAIQSFRYAGAVIDLVSESFRNTPTETKIPASAFLFSRNIEVKDVCYQYPGAQEQALTGICLNIPWRSTVGFIGSSGAGKSTLIDLILGLLPPTKGVIAVDGVDIQSNLPGWQRLIGYVPQTIYLSDDTLRRNIAYCIADEDISDEAVMRALRAAQLEAFIKGLPEGLDTVVGERGVRLSGGQRQRIGIARALYHDPELLVLDEATSALDSETESAVMNAIISLHGMKTILIVAHRTSTISHCDRVFSIDKGMLVSEN